jgi:hypothetical protein
MNFKMKVKGEEMLLETTTAEDGSGKRLLRLASRFVWIVMGCLAWHKLIKAPGPMRPLWLHIALGAYALLAAMAIASAAYLRYWAGSRVPYRRWRLYIPLPIYVMSTLQVFAFASLLLAGGLTLASFSLACVINLGVLSALSFVH